MVYDKPIIEIIEECAYLLTKIGKIPFTRKDIINLIRWKYDVINESTINSMIQGLTENLNGGAPGAINKNILHSVGRGKFMLVNNKQLVARG